VCFYQEKARGLKQKDVHVQSERLFVNSPRVFTIYLHEHYMKLTLVTWHQVTLCTSNIGNAD
jgi:hypothetical protein